MTRTLTRQEHTLLTRALIHLATEYTAASLLREQGGDGRSARMRLVRHAHVTQQLARLIQAATAIDVQVHAAEIIPFVST